ncbi:MAG: NACHT domain-containing protein [candidate division Zixibacteria bacterium]|nr:NACHT domain-containing protein [candidate division Zixibacteria bacterium]
MPIELAALLYELVKKIVFDAISKRVNYTVEKYLTQRKIERRLEDSIAQVVEQLVPFFESEHITEDKQRVLLATCDIEMSKLLQKPQEFFASSLDGQKVFDRRYADGVLPEAIREEQLGDLYAQVFPQIANLVCAYPPAVELWRLEGYRDGFRRLDDIAATLGGVANKLDQLASRDADSVDILLKRVRQSLVQRVEFHLDLTGLRGERPDAVPLEKCFVVPQLGRRVVVADRRDRSEVVIGTEPDILQVFARPKARCVVHGAPGSGKSTWSRWLQRLLLLGGNPRLAVLVKLREFVSATGLPSQQELLRAAAGTHLSEEINSAGVREWCGKGLIVFILDGFDEVPPDKRDSFCKWISDLDTASDNAGVILTSRPLTTQHMDTLPDRWMKWELLPFGKNRVSEYVSRWYAHTPLLSDKPRDVDADGLAEKWVNDPVLHPLIGIPLMLATVLMVHHMDGALPQGRAKLYERYVDGMLGLWDSRWGVPATVELTRDLKRRVLTALALHLHVVELDQIGDAEIEHLIADILAQFGCTHPVALVLDHLRERSGLLIGPGSWSFVHKNVGEYLVAAAIRDGDRIDAVGAKFDRFRLFAARHDDRWSAILFFWGGLASPGDLQTFIEQLMKYVDPRDSLLALSLIFDQLQLQRLPARWVHDQLLKILRHGVSSDDTLEMQYVCYPVPSFLGSLKVLKGAHPRGFGMLSLLNVLSKCMVFSGITWEEASQAHESLLPLAWISIIDRPLAGAELRSALSVGSRPTIWEDGWETFAASWGLIDTLRGLGAVRFEEYLSTVRECLPELSGKLAFILMGHFVVLTNGDSGSKEHLEPLLNAIRDECEKEVDRVWLDATAHFVAEFIEDDSVDGTLDLLSEFLQRIEGAIQRGAILDGPIPEYLRSRVNQLKRIRTPRQPTPSRYL